MEPRFDSQEMAEISENFDILQDLDKLEEDDRKEIGHMVMIQEGYGSQFEKTVTDDLTLRREDVSQMSQDTSEDFLNSVINTESFKREKKDHLKYNHGKILLITL